MDINWYGHSCFRLKGKNAVVILDPCGPETGYTMARVEADVVTVSHQHQGHNNTGCIEGTPRVINGAGEYEHAGVFITGIASFHDDKNGQERGKNTMYLVEIDGVMVCHLGDLGHVITAKTAGEFGKVDVLLLPVGGTSTIDATGAAEVMRRLAPKIVIPMHYRTAVSRTDIAGVDRFIKELGAKEAPPQPRLSASTSNLPVVLQVVQLEYPGSRNQST